MRPQHPRSRRALPAAAPTPAAAMVRGPQRVVVRAWAVVREREREREQGLLEWIPVSVLPKAQLQPLLWPVGVQARVGVAVQASARPGPVQPRVLAQERVTPLLPVPVWAAPRGPRPRFRVRAVGQARVRVPGWQCAWPVVARVRAGRARLPWRCCQPSDPGSSQGEAMRSPLRVVRFAAKAARRVAGPQSACGWCRWSPGLPIPSRLPPPRPHCPGQALRAVLWGAALSACASVLATRAGVAPRG